MLKQMIAMAGKVVLFALILIFFFAAMGLGAEYFVDGVRGNAVNPGTRGLPKKTISQALVKAGPGDIVWISSGTYREVVHFRRGGSDAQHLLSLRALPGADVQIKGSDLVTGWTLQSGSTWKKTNWEVNSQQVFANGEPLRQIGDNSPLNRRKYNGRPILPATGQGLSDMSSGSFWYDQSVKTLYVWLKDNGNPNQATMEASVRNVIIPPSPQQPKDFIELVGLKFSHANSTSKGGQWGLVNVLGRSWRIDGCSFNYGDFAGLRLAGEEHRLTNNVINHNGAVGIALSGSDPIHHWKRFPDRAPQNILLEGNETSYNNYRNFLQGWGGGGMKAIPSCNTIMVRKHKADNNNGNGIWFDTWARNITIEQCTVKNNAGSGIFYEVSDDGLIFNNLVVNNAKNGIYVASSSGTKVFNNDVIHNNVGISIHGVPKLKPRIEHPTLENNMVMNNIIADNKHADLVIYHNPANAKNNTSDYNLFFNRGGGVKIAWTSNQQYKVNFTDLKAFSAATQQGVHSRVGDPLWTNPASGDYALRPGSPALGAGSSEIERYLPGRPSSPVGRINIGVLSKTFR